MKGVGKMKKLQYLEVDLPYYGFESDPECLDDTTQYFPNSLKYLKCHWYPFLYLPKTFQANNLLGLELNYSRMVQLWEEGEKKVSAPCTNLKFLNLSHSRLRSLDLELIPNLEKLDLEDCDELVEINAPVGCLKKVGYLNLSGCLRFKGFKIRGRSEPKINCNSATLALVCKSLDLCPLHPNSNLPKLQFDCRYEEDLPSSVGNIEKLISFGLCACTDLKKLSDIICSLQCLQSLELEGDIPEFLKDLGQLECLEELGLSSRKIKHLPDSICMLKRLKSLKVCNGDLLEKLPQDLGKLECLENLFVRGEKIEYLPDSICMLKRLKSLEVRTGDLLEKLPEDLGNLECLENLYVRGEKIENLPDSICMLKRLKSLVVNNCDLLQKLPDDLGRLECLEMLYVTKCCCLGKLPEDIGHLECLEELYLLATMIKHLPDSICMLKHLNFLNLHRCALLEKLPEDLGRLGCLEYLDIRDTGVSHLPQSIFGLKGLEIAASSELLQLYDFPSEIKTTTESPHWCRY
nr:disease resistance protein (TIR-NBS-LRR class) family [Tanacetum cinerariifolium]